MAMFFWGGFVLNLGAADPLQVSQDLHIRGDYQGAESILRESLKSEPDNQRRAAFLNRLADLLREQDRSGEARLLFEETLDLTGISWRLRFAALMGIADLDNQDRLWARSASEWNDLIALAVSNGDRVYESYGIRGLGEMWLNQGDYARAEPLLKRAMALIVNEGATADRMAVALDSLATLYCSEDKTSMAEDLWQRELKLVRGLFGDYHPQTGLVLGHLAEVSAKDGDFARAREYSRQVVSIMTSHFAADSIPVAVAFINSAIVEERARAFDASAEFFAKALDILRTSGHRPAATAEIAKMYADVLSQLHRKREAKQVVAEFSIFPPAK